MSSTRLAVLRAVLALVADALPGVEVIGLTASAAKPSRVPAGGRAVVRKGDPGEAEQDLSPLIYNYRHSIPVELDAYGSGTQEPGEVIDAMLQAIGAAVAADRTLGGLCHWLDVEAAEVDDLNAEGARAGASATPLIIAHYSTTNPLN